MQNSHSLRLKLDARKPMWTMCINRISVEGAKQQLVYCIHDPTASKPRSDLPLHVYRVMGKRGTLYRFGTPSFDPKAIISLSGHLLSREYLSSEAPLLEMPVIDYVKQMLEDKTQMLNSMAGIVVKEGAQVFYGVHRGSIEEHFSGLFCFDDAGNLIVKDIETRANAHNGPALCAFIGIKQKEKEELLARFQQYALPKAVKAARPPSRGKR